MAQKKVNAVIHSQEKLAEGIYSMWLDAPEMAEAAVPGQFIAVYTNDPSKLLPRPISICEVDKENGRLRKWIPLKEEKSVPDRRRYRNPANAGACKKSGLRKDCSHRLQR